MKKMPALAKSQLRMQQGNPTDQDVAVINQATAKQSNLPATPSQIIIQGIIAQQQHQLEQNAIWAKNAGKILAEKYYTPGMQMREAYEQYALQNEQVKKQLLDKMKAETLANLAPKETVQSYDTQQYLDPKRVEELERIYAGAGMRKRMTPEMKQRIALSLFNSNLNFQQWPFVDPASDSMTRPLGDKTNQLLEF